MRRFIIVVFAFLTLSTVARAAEYNTPPLLTFNNSREINKATYSSMGRWMPGETRYFSFGTREFTDYSEAVPANQKGIPVVISVQDSDDGQVLKARVILQNTTYNIHWRTLDGETTAPTGKKVTGFAFIPMTALNNTTSASDTMTIIVDNFENATDSAPVSTVSTLATLKIDRTAPVANITSGGNSITVNSVSKLPCKLMVQMKDPLGNWNPPVETIITACPASYEYDSLWHPGVTVKYWVEDMLGNTSTTADGDIGTPNDKIDFIGHADDNRATYAAFIGIRLGTEEKLNARYFAFLGG